MELCVSICALMLSCVSVFWQVINGVKRLNVEISEWYINKTKNDSIHYVFRLAFINKSFNSISISAISIKYGSHTENFDFQKTTLLFKSVLDDDGSKAYENRLYSSEIPFRIDGLGVYSGYFGIWDLPDPELICENETAEIIIYTNRGKVKKKIIVPKLKDIHDIRF